MPWIGFSLSITRSPEKNEEVEEKKQQQNGINENKRKQTNKLKGNGDLQLSKLQYFVYVCDFLFIKNPLFHLYRIHYD